MKNALKVLILFVILALPAISQAQIVREIDGVKYHVLDDMDTADGECVLRGKEEFESFTSQPNFSKEILQMNRKGEVVKIITPQQARENDQWVITSLSCF